VEYHGLAINAALQRICERIGELGDGDEEGVDYWATLQFVRVIEGVKKKHKKERQRKADLSDPDDEDASDPLDRFEGGGKDPGEEAAYRERLRIVQPIVQLSREAYLRLIKDLPVGEVSRLTGRSPEWIRTFTMRLRRALREYLDADGSRSPEGIFGTSGLPKDFVTRILELLRNSKS
jgi:hypothetical protein